MVENKAEMKEIAPLGKIYSLAERRAVAGIYRCSGVERFQSGLFDRTDRLAGLKESEARIAREVRRVLGIRLTYQRIEEPCAKTDGIVRCRVLLMGTIDIDPLENRFEVLSWGTGKWGVYQDRESIQFRFTLKHPAKVYLFDVGENGQAVLLFPGTLPGGNGTPHPAGFPFVFPPDEAPGVHLVAARPRKGKREIRFLWILALGGQKFLDAKDFRSMKSGPFDLPHVENFMTSILPRFRRSIGEGAWGLRVIPYEVAPASSLPGPPPEPPKMSGHPSPGSK